VEQFQVRTALGGVIEDPQRCAGKEAANAH
jgi:hypothetical protein